MSDDLQQPLSKHDDEMNRLLSQCDDYLAGWKRAQADYANLKRDMERERLEFAKYANQRLLQEILPAVDQFEAALSFAPVLATLPEDEDKKFKNWLMGLQAVRSLWENAFKDIGLQKVSVQGSFNPQLHEAVGHEPSEHLTPGTIIRSVQDGWMLHEKLLRPAKVIIASDTSNS